MLQEGRRESARAALLKLLFIQFIYLILSPSPLLVILFYKYERRTFCQLAQKPLQLYVAQKIESRTGNRSGNALLCVCASITQLKETKVPTILNQYVRIWRPDSISLEKIKLCCCHGVQSIPNTCLTHVASFPSENSATRANPHFSPLALPVVQLPGSQATPTPEPVCSGIKSTAGLCILIRRKSGKVLSSDSNPLKISCQSYLPR